MKTYTLLFKLEKVPWLYVDHADTDPTRLSSDSSKIPNWDTDPTTEVKVKDKVVSKSIEDTSSTCGAKRTGGVEAERKQEKWRCSVYF